MALITDPDSLSQGTLKNVTDADFGSPTGQVVTVTSTANLPTIAANGFLEVRDHATALLNGLYQETGGSPTTSSITMTKISGGDISGVGDTASEDCNFYGDGTDKNVMFDTAGKQIYLLEKNGLSTDGVTMRALHSFAKIEWKSDQFLMDAAGFPIVGISFAAGQWQIGVDPNGNNNGWVFADNIASPSAVETRRLIRRAGWDEIDDQGVTKAKYFNVTTLGSFEDTANDKAYYRFGSDPTDTAAPVDFEFAGPVDEAVKYFEEVGNPTTFTYVDGGGSDDTCTRASGSFITDGFQVGGQMTTRASTTPANDGTYVITGVGALTLTFATGSFDTGEADPLAQVSVDNSNAFTCFLRVRDADPTGKTFGQSNLTDAGETGIISKKISFGLSNTGDPKITATDASITGGGPWDQIEIRYFDQAFNREVDSGTNRDFGIVVDVGTTSGVDGSAPGGASVLTSAEGGINNYGATAYNGGTLRIHEGTDENTEFPIVSHTDTTITVTGTIASATDVSFTAQRATPVVATAQQIFEKVQYQLRQASDVDITDQVVVGKTADELMSFVGDSLICGAAAPTNPNGGGSGVIIEGFDTNDTNDLFFNDNTLTQYNYPFVAAGTLAFNQLSVDDTDGEYWLFFEYTDRTTNSDIDVTSPSGDSYTLTGTLPNMAVNDYIWIQGFAEDGNNGLFIVEVETTPSAEYDVRRVDGGAVGGVETDQTVSIDENPYPSPDAILVDDNTASDIVGAITSTTTTFDFDYENNVQGGRTADTDAAVVLVVGGLETVQMTRSAPGALTITKATGLVFSVSPAQERNYDNP